MKTLILAALAAAPLFASCSSTKNSAPAMTPEQQQAAWTAYMTPGANHKLLEPMVGVFHTVVKSRISADAPWTESTGTCENRWILDGRFLETKFHGNMMGQPFEGRGLTGYDNSSQDFVGSWTDNMSTGLAPISHGKADATGKVLTLLREMKDPITGQWTKMRDVTRIQGPNAHQMESYCQQGEAPEFLMMTLQFSR
ncbi:MAG: DUF1579 domain-containing protein [Planctomycetota bacterium]|nr:DUF1579 domain-containing protein [Planctomycetota bacterium]